MMSLKLIGIFFAINFATSLDCDRYGRRCNYDNSHDLRITYSDRDNFKDVGGRGRVDITGFVDRSNQESWFKRSDEKIELTKKDQVKRGFNFHNSKLDRTNQNDYSGAYGGPSSRYHGSGGFNFHNSYLDRTDQNAYGRKKRSFNFHSSFLDRTNQNDYSGRRYYKRGFNFHHSFLDRTNQNDYSGRYYKRGFNFHNSVVNVDKQATLVTPVTPVTPITPVTRMTPVTPEPINKKNEPIKVKEGESVKIQTKSKRGFNFHNSKLDRTNQNDYSVAYGGPSSRYHGSGGFNFHNSYLDRTDQNAYGRKKRSFNFNHSFLDRTNQNDYSGRYYYKRGFNFHNSKLDRTNQNDYSGAYGGPSSRYHGSGGFNFHNSYLDRTDQNAYGRKKRSFNFHHSFLDRTNQNDYSGRYYYKRGFNYYNSVVNGNLVNPQPAVKPVIASQINPVTATPLPQVKVPDVKPVPVARTSKVKVSQGEYICSLIDGKSSCRRLSTREQSLLDKPTNPSNAPVSVISKTDSRDNIIQNSPSYLKGTKDCDSNGQRCNIYV